MVTHWGKRPGLWFGWRARRANAPSRNHLAQEPPPPSQPVPRPFFRTTFFPHRIGFFMVVVDAGQPFQVCRTTFHVGIRKLGGLHSLDCLRHEERADIPRCNAPEFFPPAVQGCTWSCTRTTPPASAVKHCRFLDKGGGVRTPHTSQFAPPIRKCLHANQNPSNTHGIVRFPSSGVHVGSKPWRALVALSAYH